MSLGKPTIKLCFMDDEMRDFAINEATKALETSNSEKVTTTQQHTTLHYSYINLNNIFNNMALL